MGCSSGSRIVVSCCNDSPALDSVQSCSALERRTLRPVLVLEAPLDFFQREPLATPVGIGAVDDLARRRSPLFAGRQAARGQVGRLADVAGGELDAAGRG